MKWKNIARNTANTREVDKMRYVCPVCGNEIGVNPMLDGFRCRYCRQYIFVSLEKKKGKQKVHLQAEADWKDELRQVQGY